MAETSTYCRAFALVAELAIALNAHPLTKHAACWEHQIDKRWWIAVNGHKEPVECSSGVTVQPANCYVTYNGWPAGVIDPFGGIIAAGEAANEQTFIEALKNATPGA